MARKRLDARTKTMSPAALTCRTIGHAMTPVPVKPERRLELRRLGQYAIRVVCMRGCRWREQVFDADTDKLLYTKGNYTDPGSYLVQEHGTGRLPRTAARAAFRRVVGEPQVDEDVLDVPPRQPKVRGHAPAGKAAPAKKTASAKTSAQAKTSTAQTPSTATTRRPRKAPPAKETAPKVAFSS